MTAIRAGLTRISRAGCSLGTLKSSDLENEHDLATQHSTRSIHQLAIQMHRHHSVLGFAVLLSLVASSFWSTAELAAQDGLQVYEPPTPAFQPDGFSQPPLLQPGVQIGEPQVLPPIVQPGVIQGEVFQPQVQPLFTPQYIEPQVLQPEIQPGIVLPQVILPELYEQPVFTQPVRRRTKPGKPRVLAPGVLKRIPIDLNPRDMFSIPRPLPGLLKVKEFTPKSISKNETLHGQSRRVMLLRENVWQYEFAFTGLRQANLKIPTSDGRLLDRNVWYMVYRIRDTGKTMTFDQVKLHPDFDHIKNELRRDKPIAAEAKKFLPRFSLEGWVVSNAANRTQKNKYAKVAYRDEIAPAILAQVQRREDKFQRLLDSHQMSQAKIPAAKNAADPGLWGVAIWTDVDPRIDYVSVYVKGLTNAYRLGSDFDDPTKLKTLQLNFWRPGDQVEEDDDYVDFGIPLVDNPAEQATICRRYDLPGPVIRGYHVNPVAKRNVLVMEADAEVSLENFQSSLTPTLDKGKLPREIADAFAGSGITVDDGAALKTIIPGKRWEFNEGQDKYILALQPQFWKPDNGAISFIKSIDHIWIYR